MWSKLKGASRKSIGCGGLLLAIIVIGFIVSEFGGGDDDKPDTAARPATASLGPKIPYKVVRDYTVPTGGHTRNIVIDPTFRTEKEIRRLARQLERDTRSDPFALVFIFDDEVAAKNHLASIEGTLDAKAEAHFESHYIGAYERNEKTGKHSLMIWPEGLNGRQVDVKM